MLSLKRHNFCFPRNAHHFHLCLLLLVIVQFLNPGTRDNKKVLFSSVPSLFPFRRGSAAALFLGLWVRIPPAAWKPVSWECCVLSGRGLCIWLVTRPAESYRVFCVWSWSWILDKEEALVHYGLLRHKKNGDVWGCEKDLSFLRCSPVMGCAGQANKFVASIKVRGFIGYISEY